MKNNLYLTVVENPSSRLHGGYKYLITNSCTSYTAYRTDKGFQDFLTRCNIRMSEVKSETQTKEFGKVQTFDLIGEIDEKSFWSTSELPQNAIQYTDLSNGSLVDCYYVHTENGSVIYRPNPNAKDVYNPMPLNKHIEFQAING